MWLSTPPTPGLKKSQTISTLSFRGASAATIPLYLGITALIASKNSQLKLSYAQKERKREKKVELHRIGFPRGNSGSIGCRVLVVRHQRQQRADEQSDQPGCS